MAAVRIQGLREAQRAFRKLDRAVSKDFKDELAHAAEPVARSAASRLVRFRGASTNVKALTLARGVYVRQMQRTVTGRRGDFGALQMRTAFLPALAEHEDEIVHEVEKAFDRFADRAGF
jgi:hypothetical protein